MTTFLPQNQFTNSAAPPAVECEAVAHAPAPLAATANLSVSDGRASLLCSPLDEVACGLSETEAAGSVRTAASDCSDHDLKFVYECIDGTMFHRCDTCGGKAYLNEIPEIFRGHHALNAINKAGSDISDIPEIFRVANLLCEDARTFIPDYPSIYQAMLDPTAPRALETDPVWADEAPLFLKSIG